MGQTLSSLGQTSSLMGQAAQSLTSSNRSTHVLANELSQIPKQTCAGVCRGGARGNTEVIISGPYKAYLSSKAPMAKHLLCKKTGKSTKGKSVSQKKKKLLFGRENRCLYCDELFEEMPDDDCIRCTVCL